MDVILKVLEGAKIGTKIAIKKDEFSIGRSPKCSLCAGSSSISRRHCVLVRQEATVSIKDLGSRNGTLINGKKISPEQQVELSSGDEITVGSLRFLVTISHGIKNTKRPQVKSVAEAVDRAAETGSDSIVEDDISNWLIDAPGVNRQAVTETQTIRMDDTNAVEVGKSEEQSSADLTESKESGSKEPGDKESTDKESAANEPLDGESEGADAGSGKQKSKPGKLPPIPSESSSKDSREAAMQALQNWNRRR